jgi:hypothetical protein
LLDYLALDDIDRLLLYPNQAIDFCELLRTWQEEAKKKSGNLAKNAVSRDKLH